ncbi:MAG: GGDEF domain-containing protein [Methylomonas sp.]|nr:MAG: GGDEF domain-containing protein [Methylobacter sp.]PPD36199.1 MAG: GGDEF domain-containing protein [Methylomonas sp.]
MSKSVSFLPVYSGSSEQHKLLLKQGINLMGQYGIPAHPINYAIFYDYCTGQNESLKIEIDTILAEQQGFDDETSLRLYKTFVCNSTVDRFENMHNQLNELIAKIYKSIDITEIKTTLANEHFAQTSLDLRQQQTPQALEQFLTHIISESHQLSVASKMLKSELELAKEGMERLKKEISKTRTIAKIDALTGLLNRGAFEDELRILFSTAKPQQLSLALLDLDHFKRINDNFGHLVGDKVLKFFGGLILKHTRKHHIAARYGGEEIVILMPNTSLQDAVDMNENLRKFLECSQLKRTDKNEPIGKVTVSVGITQLTEHDTMESFIDRADQALYQAKNQGRNQVVVKRA